MKLCSNHAQCASAKCEAVSARDDRGGRLPPGQVQTTKLPILHLGDVPKFNPKTWRLRIKGEIAKPIELTFDQLLALPRTLSVSDFHCVTSWSRFDNQWEGLLVRDLIEIAHLLPQVKFVSFEAEGGYHTSLPLEVAKEDNVILAWRLDGADLDPAHGWPLRLVVPKKYAYKSAKWVRVVRFLDSDSPGYWEQRGYSNNADPWKEERLVK